MTGIHPIQGFNNLSKPKKIAAIAAGTAIVGAAATTAVAFAKGKKADAKGLEAIKKGYGILFDAAKARAGKIREAIVSHLPKKGEETAKAATKASEKATEEGEAILNATIPN